MDLAALIKEPKSGRCVRVAYSAKSEDWFNLSQWWSEESDFNNFAHYECGECAYREEGVFDPDYIDNYDFEF